jgi:chromate transporter
LASAVAARTPAPADDVVAFGDAARAWFLISLQTFGGPAGQIAVMQRTLVEEHPWIGQRRFLHALSFCTLLPGPEAQELAICIGWLLNGIRGGLVATWLFVLPGVVGVIAHLAVFFAVHTLFSVVTDADLGPAHLARPDLGSARPLAFAILAVAALLLFWRGWSVLRTLGVCALLGLAAACSVSRSPERPRPRSGSAFSRLHRRSGALSSIGRAVDF